MPTGIYKRTKKHRQVTSTTSHWRKPVIQTLEIKKKISIANTGSRNGNWKGGRTISSQGYALIRIERKVYKEHRYVMEQFIGRPLFRNENVHHLNGIKDDNRIENLELWTTPPTRGIRAKEALEYAREVIKRYGSIQDKL